MLCSCGESSMCLPLQLLGALFSDVLPKLGWELLSLGVQAGSLSTLSYLERPQQSSPLSVGCPSIREALNPHEEEWGIF